MPWELNLLTDKSRIARTVGKLNFTRLWSLVVLAYAFILEISLLTTESASGHSL